MFSFSYYTLQRVKHKGVDQTAQTMHVGLCDKVETW